jgi:signal peptidase I
MIIVARVAHRLISMVLTLIVIVVATISVLSALDALRVHNEIGSSMTPTIRRGDLVLYRPVTADRLRTGDIIGFHWPGSDLTITHRVVRVSRAGSAITLSTKGDASPSADKDPIVFAPGTSLWRVTAVVPWLGPLVSVLTNSGVPLVAGLVPLFLGLPWIEKQLRIKAQKAAMAKAAPDLSGAQPEGQPDVPSQEAPVAEAPVAEAPVAEAQARLR